MKRVKKILDIENQSINYIAQSPLAIEICHIFHTPAHYHSNAVELVFCIKGQLTIRCNHETITLKSGEIFTIDFQDLHCLYSDHDNLAIILHIDLKKSTIPWNYLEYVYFACEDLKYQPYQYKPLQQIKNIILAATYQYTKQGNLSDGMCAKIANQLLKILLEFFDWFNYINIYPNQNDEIRERFQSIMAYCHNNYMDKLTIAQLAQQVHINENYFSQFLRKSAYGSFSNMVGFIRCFNAQYLLLTTEMTVYEISQHCGFSDDKYFYKQFRFWWKKTPTEHRDWFKKYAQETDQVMTLSSESAFRLLEPFLAEYLSKNILEL